MINEQDIKMDTYALTGPCGGGGLPGYPTHSVRVTHSSGIQVIKSGFSFLGLREEALAEVEAKLEVISDLLAD